MRSGSGPVPPRAKTSSRLTRRMRTASGPAFSMMAFLTCSYSSSGIAPPKKTTLGTRRSDSGTAALLPCPEAGTVERSPAQRAGSSVSAAERERQEWTTGCGQLKLPTVYLRNAYRRCRGGPSLGRLRRSCRRGHRARLGPTWPWLVFEIEECVKGQSCVFDGYCHINCSSKWTTRHTYTGPLAGTHPSFRLYYSHRFLFLGPRNMAVRTIVNLNHFDNASQHTRPSHDYYSQWLITRTQPRRGDGD